MEVDAGVLVHAGSRLFTKTVKVDAVDGASNGRAARLARNIEIGASGFRGTVMRADGDKFVYEICSEVQPLRRFDGGEADAARSGKVHRDGAEIAESTIHAG